MTYKHIKCLTSTAKMRHFSLTDGQRYECCYHQLQSTNGYDSFKEFYYIKKFNLRSLLLNNSISNIYFRKLCQPPQPPCKK